ncbi:MAG: hypothetical protein U0802_19140 [Candidatus Binatia bacterium]
MRAGALHPALLLLLALAGALSGWRRATFLLGGFGLGLAPTVLAWGRRAHRMMMAFPFVALAAAAACDDLVRGAAGTRRAASLVGATALWSVRLYFSDRFWTEESRWLFDPERTELVASLPLDAGRPVILQRQVTQFREPRRLLAAADRHPGGGALAAAGVRRALRLHRRGAALRLALRRPVRERPTGAGLRARLLARRAARRLVGAGRARLALLRPLRLPWCGAASCRRCTEWASASPTSSAASPSTHQWAARWEGGAGAPASPAAAAGRRRDAAPAQRASTSTPRCAPAT